VAAVAFLTPAVAQTFHTYIGNLSHNSVTIAWGTTRGSGNTIGRGSQPHGRGHVRINERDYSSGRNWVHITGLTADTDYDYTVFIDGRRVGAGSFRTWAENSNKLAFFVIGDYGNDSGGQHRVAAAMWREFLRRSQTDNPVRFVITTGDNIYGWGVWPVVLGSGDRDSHWRDRFYVPYEEVIRRIPFYPTLGNHDCGESESSGDLDVYLDNFFFPEGSPAQFYRFHYGNLAEFFALDTTNCVLSGDSAPQYLEDGEQFRWLRSTLPASKAVWKIPYFHHPPFTAGPEHAPRLEQLRHFVKLFQETGVSVVFNGHEHNFQYTGKGQVSGDVLYVVSGAGGELRDRAITPRLSAAGIAAAANQRHFTVVEIEGKTMRITPVGERPIELIGPDGKARPLPVVVNAR
jgi:hypothetical protein